MRRKRALNVVLQVLLCLGPMLSPAESPAQGPNQSPDPRARKAQVSLKVGQPSIWSLAQAHYLLAVMRENNRALTTPLPSLNPNDVTGLRADIVTQLFGADVEFNGALGQQNRLATQQFQSDMARKQLAIVRLGDKSNEQQAVFDELNRVSKKVVALKATQADLTAIPDTQRTADQTSELAALKAKIDNLTQEQTLLTSQQTALATDITQLTTQASAAPSTTVPSLTGVFGTPTGQTGPNTTGLPLTNYLSTLLKTPTSFNAALAATTQLDNYIQMQYEIISKQLTLLRDEVGPGKRLVFLELPSSIYTVPGKSDDYLVDIQWQVNKYYGPEPTALLSGPEDVESDEKDLSTPVTLEYLNSPAAQTSANVTYQKLNTKLGTMRWVDIDGDANAAQLKSRFRTIDVIPRQSALNINDTNAKSTGLNLAGGFQWLTGIGAKVSYQRQHEVYQQFVHQESFVTGSGRGMHEFGWTFGPVPGTNRIAPGTRSTYAILVVPSRVLALGLRATGKTFEKKQAPDDQPIQLTDEQFQVLVPNKLTEGFWVDGIAYTPVPQGQRATVVLTGRYFSPLTGVLVNGAPLSRAVSIGKNESDRSTNVAGAQGEYEYLSPNKIVLSFSMGPDYTGTPLITLVTPEKTSAINYFDLQLNFDTDDPKRSLLDLSKTYPMFLHKLAISDIQMDDWLGGTRSIRLIGDGFRKDGEVAINGTALPVPKEAFRDTGRYEFSMSRETYSRIARAAENPDLTHDSAGKWLVRYRQRTDAGYDETLIQWARPVESQYDITSYNVEPRTGDAAMDVTISVTGNVVSAQANPYDLAVGPIIRTSEGPYLIRLTLKRDKDDVPLLLTRDDGLVKELIIQRPASPTIDALVNPQTGKAEGPAGTEHIIRILGKNLKHVVQVRLNSAEAQILGAEHNVLLVRTPKIEEGPAQVYLKSALTIQGKAVTNVHDFSYPNKATYTFRSRRRDGSRLSQVFSHAIKIGRPNIGSWLLYCE
jgi:hypothetical protein